MWIFKATSKWSSTTVVFFAVGYQVSFDSNTLRICCYVQHSRKSNEIFFMCLKGNSGVKLKVFCMFVLRFMSQFLITSFPYRFVQMKY